MDNQPSGAIEPGMITSKSIFNTHFNILKGHMRQFYPDKPTTLRPSRKKDSALESEEQWELDTIEALALRAPKYMLPTSYVELVDEYFLPYAKKLRDKYQGGKLAVSLVLQLFEVAGRTFTDLEEGWRRVQVMKIALPRMEEGIYLGFDPRRSFGEAVRFGLLCRSQLLGPELWDEIEALSKSYGFPLEVGREESIQVGNEDDLEIENVEAEEEDD